MHDVPESCQCVPPISARHWQPVRAAGQRPVQLATASEGAGTDPDRGQSGGTGLLIRYSRASGPPTHSKLHTKLKFKLAAHLT